MPRTPRPKRELSTKAHQETALQVAEESIVLLKNENILPLDASRLKSIAIIGVNAVTKFASGGGAANIKAPYEITALEGISNRAGANLKITYSPGYQRPGGRGGRRGQPAAADAVPPDNAALITSAVEAAKSADIVIYVGGLSHGRGGDEEGSDRADMKLPGSQDELLAKIVEANPKTIVIFNGGGPVEMGSWLEKTPAVLYAWYGGLEAGNALAHVLFGDVDASGRLPCTFPKQLADSPAHALNAYPGSDTVNYVEALLVGYRWFDIKKIEPLFAFGHGLSYTTFEYSNLKLLHGIAADGPLVTVECDVANTGSRAGEEVPQVYVQEMKPRLARPVKELKGFAKIPLKPGEKKTVSITLPRSAFSYYDPDKSSWASDAGDFRIIVGSSSRNIRLDAPYHLASSAVER